MDLAMPTFLWLREFGTISTNHAVPGRTKGMLALTPEGLRTLQQGKGIVRLLSHYCCHRFDVPEQLHPMDGEAINVKRHNWAVTSKILEEALDFELPWERRELIIAGDIVEMVVLLKQIHELVKPHRDVDKQLKFKHKHMHDNRVHVDVKHRLVKEIQEETPNPVAVKAQGLGRPYQKPWAPKRADRSPSPPLHNRNPPVKSPPPAARVHKLGGSSAHPYTNAQRGSTHREKASTTATSERRESKPFADDGEHHHRDEEEHQHHDDDNNHHPDDGGASSPPAPLERKGTRPGVQPSSSGAQQPQEDDDGQEGGKAEQVVEADTSDNAGAGGGGGGDGAQDDKLTTQQSTSSQPDQSSQQERKASAAPATAGTDDDSTTKPNEEEENTDAGTGEETAPADWRGRVTAMYEKYCPEKLDNVENILAKYRGNEAQLMDALVGKYGPEPTSTA